MNVYNWLVGVSVSSRSYILSYGNKLQQLALDSKHGFRLLSELYSLLSFAVGIKAVVSALVSVSSRSYILSYIASITDNDSVNSISFRLLSELYSLLFGSICYIQ